MDYDAKIKCTKPKMDFLQWYFKPGFRLFITIPIFLDVILLFFIVVLKSYATAINLWNMGGLLVYLIGLGEGLIFLLLFSSYEYARTPYMIDMYISKTKNNIKTPTKYLIIIATMVSIRFCIAVLIYIYSFF